jgi:hypothetical protein
MAFCGVTLQARRVINESGEVELRPCHFLDPSTMTKFRRRVGAEGMRVLPAWRQTGRSPLGLY